MSEVFIPISGVGGKNRGTVAVIGDNAPFSNAGAVMSLPLPAGNYKKSVSNPRTSYGDGKNSEVTISKELLKKMALEAFGIASITNFSLSMYAHRQVRLTWAKPSQGLWSGVHFVFKYGSMPTSETDGFMQIDSADVYYTTDRLQETDLYVRAYNYVTVKDGRWYDEGAVSSHIRVTGINGAVTLSAGAGTWTVPDGVRRIRYILVGHGGSAGIAYTNNVGTGGGGGGYFTTGYLDVSPGQQINWIIPSEQGAPTSFSGIVANSGTTGNDSYYSTRQVYGGNGGSGGGAGIHNRSGINRLGGEGGLDGNDGGQSTSYDSKSGEYLIYNGSGWQNTGGIGQHTSTRGFNGVLYSGGGNGGGCRKAHQEGGGGASINYAQSPRKR